MGIGFKHWRWSSVCLVDHLGTLQDIKPCCFHKTPVSILTRWRAEALAGPGGRCVLASKRGMFLPNGEQRSGEVIKLHYRITTDEGQRMQEWVALSEELTRHKTAGNNFRNVAYPGNHLPLHP